MVLFEANLWEELGRLQMELLWGTWLPGPYRSFLVYEPKRREILAAPYRDRVAQHAICNICGPIWDRSMIFDSYACRLGKGTHAGADRVQRWLRGMAPDGDIWVLKMDISKYFASIRHDLAKAVVRDKISCAATLHLLDAVVDSAASSHGPACGIPVGNLTSQWIANLVGSRIDQWAKRELRLKRYIRYMDDMVVLVRAKAQAIEIREAFAEYLAALGFTFSKASVLPIAAGINFLGYRIWPHKRLLRKNSVRRMRRRMRMMAWLYSKGEMTLEAIRQHIAAWAAHAGHANSYNSQRQILGREVFVRRL